ncbi:MAG: DUF4194 domain-containing protein [Firmicutes bacterium]|nr:DUF4194 domain-containing protein [Bacillota bacterium]
MPDLELILEIKDNSADLFKRCIRKLLSSTFILRDKDPKLYSYLARESNRQDVADYLKVIGFDLLSDEKTGVCMLIASEEDAETVGLKQANVVTFTTLQYHMLLVLWKVYLQQVGYNAGNFISRGDLLDQIKSYGLQVSPGELSAAFKLFKKYSLIDYANDEIGQEDALIELYPSLQFGWDLRQFRTVSAQYIREEASNQNDGIVSKKDGPGFEVFNSELFNSETYNSEPYSSEPYNSEVFDPEESDPEEFDL